MFGYCKEGARFYQPGQFYASNIKAVCLQYGFDDNKVQLINYNERTFNYYKKIILEYLILKPFNDEAKTFFMKSINDRVARRYTPKQILEDVLELLKTKRIEIPRYNRFALINITQAISDYDKLGNLFCTMH